MSDTRSEIKKQVDIVLGTEEGRAVFAWLFNECGYNMSSLTRMTTGEIAPLSTECKEAMRLVYIRLRQLASPDLLAVAERLAETPPIITKPLIKEK